MQIGTMLHHKYFNGVVPANRSSVYKYRVTGFTQSFGMRGTGIFAMVAPKGPSPDSYEWRNVDKIVEFCERNNLRLHYNTVLFGHLDGYPEWFKELTPEAKLRALERHVRLVVGRYKYKVEFFKLMNESLGGDSIDFLGTGKSRVELISNVFQWAKETYPEGKYMWNEHSPSFREDTRNEFLQIVREVQARGVSPDIIGLQAHMGYRPRPFKLPPDQDIKDALTGIHEKTEVPLQITEFDLSWNNNRQGEDKAEMKIDPNKPIVVDEVKYKTWFEYQAYAYQHFAEICMGLDFVKGFYYWAFNENEPWERPDCGLFDDDFKPRPEMQEWLFELQEGKVPREDMLEVQRV